MMSTFLFVQVSNFSITLSNYTGNIFESSTNSKMSDTMLTMFISYRDGYKNSSKFKEDKSIEQLVKSGSFNDDELYISKYVTKSRIIFQRCKRILVMLEGCYLIWKYYLMKKITSMILIGLWQ